MAHERLEVGGESFPVHLLQADDVRIVSQDLLHDQRPPVLWDHISADTICASVQHHLTSTTLYTIVM